MVHVSIQGFFLTLRDSAKHNYGSRIPFSNGEVDDESFEQVGVRVYTPIQKRFVPE